MILKYFQIYDSKAQAYRPPYYAVTRGVGVRQFTAAANDAAHEFHLFAADYTLFECGDWDDLTGDHTAYGAKLSLGTALEALANNNLTPPSQEEGETDDGNQ